MLYKKFEPGDVLRNVIKAHPENSVFIDASGSSYIKSLNRQIGSEQNNSYLVAGTSYNALAASGNYALITDINGINPTVSPLVPRNMTQQEKFALESVGQYYSYGFLTSSIGIIPFRSTQAAEVRYQLRALKTTLEWYSSVTPAYSYDNYTAGNLMIVNIPSIFYGSSIKKGSVSLDFYITGTLIGRLEDYRLNGELVQTLPSGSQNSGSTAGVVLYDEGLILLSGSWSLVEAPNDRYNYIPSISINEDTPKWVHWGKSLLSSSLLRSSSFEINFEGTNYISNITMFAHADKNEFNTTVNKTYIEYNQENFNFYVTGANFLAENRELLIKNTIKNSYQDTSGSFKKQTFINKIGIYDKDKKLIAVAKLATPVKKNNERDYTFKLKLDI